MTETTAARAAGFPTRSGLALAAAALVAALLIALTPASARAEFGVQAFDGQVTANPAGEAYTQAGGHPHEAWSLVRFNSHLDPYFGFLQFPDADAKNVLVDLPPGLVGNTTVVPRCTWEEFYATAGHPGCSPQAQVGQLLISLSLSPQPLSRAALFAMEPAPGQVAQFAAKVFNTPVVLTARLRNDDYGISLDAPNAAQGLKFYAAGAKLWGNPADPYFDEFRCQEPEGELGGGGLGECTGEPGDPKSGPNAARYAPVPLITMPTVCTPPGVGLVTRVRTDSWQNPGQYESAEFESHLPPSFLDDPNPATWGPPQGPTGCEDVPFRPSAAVTPASPRAGAPTGLAVELAVPQDGLLEPDGIASSHLKDVEVTLPAGMSLNPAAANGLASCTDAQMGFGNGDPVACPDASRIGTASARTPLLAEEISGALFLGSQLSDDPASGQMYRVFLLLESEERGLRIKLPGEVKVGPDGRIRTQFRNNPQLPVATIAVELNGGERAPLVNPRRCGLVETALALTPWVDGVPRPLSSFAELDEGCGAGSRFTPRFEAGTANPSAGKSTAMAVTIARDDEDAEFTGLSDVDLPRGLLAKISGVPPCGAAAADRGACPAASRIGHVQVAAGAGAEPLWLPQPGKPPTSVFLAGPYRGAPYSLSVVVPAQAGPFELGTVVTRLPLHVDPVTAQISSEIAESRMYGVDGGLDGVVQGGLPTVLKGIPLQIRTVRMLIGRGDFVRNPTSCAEQQIGASLRAANVLAPVSDRFQPANCASLGFKPKLSLRLKGKTHRSAHPALTATLKARPGDANIGRAVVTLPKTQFLAQEHIRTICTRVQYAAESCPKGSVYGYAKAWTPLLDQPLEGPVYLRSSDNKLPDLVADLNGQIEIDLAGRIDSVEQRMRTTFWAVPDAPVSKFVLRMQGGKKGLLVNNTQLCAKKPRAKAAFTGHNGKRIVAQPRVRLGCGKAK